MQYVMLAAVQESVMNHLWYLTEELVVFGLFDCNLADEERKEMAIKLLASPRPRQFPPGKPRFPRNLMSRRPSLDSFVGKRSWSLFEKLHAVGNWLQLEVGDWSKTDEYKRMRSCLSDLKVVNDLAERCVIKSVKDLRNVLKQYLSQMQNLLMVLGYFYTSLFHMARGIKFLFLTYLDCNNPCFTTQRMCFMFSSLF